MLKKFGDKQMYEVDGPNGRGVMTEFMQVLPHLSKPSIASILRDLKDEGAIEFQGKPKTGYWMMKESTPKV